MRSSKIITLLVATAVLCLATATSAFAADSGTVYGQATMQPTISISLGTHGSAEFPLTYVQGVSYEWETNHLNVENSGDVPVKLFVQSASAPADGHGNTWTFGDFTWSSTNTCVWTIGNTFVPDQGSNDMQTRVAAQDTGTTGTSFEFPTTYSGNTFHMSALITAEQAAN